MTMFNHIEMVSFMVGKDFGILEENSGDSYNILSYEIDEDTNEIMLEIIALYPTKNEEPFGLSLYDVLDDLQEHYSECELSKNLIKLYPEIWI